MHKDILSEKQQKLLPLISNFSSDFLLVGGTAIALFLGHRESIDFDLFSNKKFNNSDIIKKIKENHEIDQVVVDKLDEFTAIIEGVKITFLYYPYRISAINNFENIIKTPDILTLGAMKAYALGRRAKWKDYVDIYFITRKHTALEKIIEKAKEIFKNDFSEKNFRVQLSYFTDIDFSENIIWKKGFEVEKEDIQEHLKKISVSW